MLVSAIELCVSDIAMGLQALQKLVGPIRKDAAHSILTVCNCRHCVVIICEAAAAQFCTFPVSSLL